MLHNYSVRSEDQENACCVKKTNCPHLDEPILGTNETRAGEIIISPGNGTIALLSHIS